MFIYNKNRARCHYASGPALFQISNYSFLIFSRRAFTRRQSSYFLPPIVFRFRPCDLQNPAFGIGKKFLERKAGVVFQLAIVLHPVALAAAVAQAVPATVGAGIGFALALLQKQAGFFAVGQLRDALLSNAAHLPFVQAVKVTGVHRAVALHHKISAAAARGGTGACRHAHRHVDVIVKQTHTGVVAVDPVTVVNVKQAAQELTVCFRRQCPGLRTTLALKGI